MALPPGPETDARHAREAADPNYRRRTPQDGVGPKYIYDPGHREPERKTTPTSDKVDKFINEGGNRSN